MLPSDLDIFSPVSRSIPLCIQTRAKRSPAASDCARSFSWCGKDQIEAAAVHVEVLAQLDMRHGRALDVPARATAPPGRVPGGVLARLRGLPEREVERRALALAGLDAGSRDQVVGSLTGELAVRRVGGDAEVHVAVAARVGRAALDQALDQRDDLLDRQARQRFRVRPSQAQRVGVGSVGLGHLARQQRRGNAALDRCGIDLVVDVGDVDGQSHRQVEQLLGRALEHHRRPVRPRVAHVDAPVHRRAAAVDAQQPGRARLDLHRSIPQPVVEP